MDMEWPSWEQIKIKWWPDVWPKKISSKELQEELDKANDEFRRAGNYGRRKGEDLASKEETTKALEEKGVKPIRILSRKESAKKAREIVEKLDEKEKNGKKNMEKKKS
jgi:hypothetical protein